MSPSRKTGFWVGSVLLCWASAATAQAVGGMLAAQTSATVSAQVNANVNAAVNQAAGSASGPGGPALGARISAATQVAPAQPEAEILSDRNTASQSLIPTAAATAAGETGTSRVPAESKSAPRAAGEAGEGAYAGLGGFPDSTKGTALISPFDSGTGSSLQWSPSFGFEFPDMQATQFLNPTLRVTGSLSHPLQRRYVTSGSLAGSTLQPTLEQPALPKSSALNTSIDQQLGLPGEH